MSKSVWLVAFSLMVGIRAEASLGFRFRDGLGACAWSIAEARANHTYQWTKLVTDFQSRGRPDTLLAGLRDDNQILVANLQVRVRNPAGWAAFFDDFDTDTDGGVAAWNSALRRRLQAELTWLDSVDRGQLTFANLVQDTYLAISSRSLVSRIEKAGFELSFSVRPIVDPTPNPFAPDRFRIDWKTKKILVRAGPGPMPLPLATLLALLAADTRHRMDLWRAAKPKEMDEVVNWANASALPPAEREYFLLWHEVGKQLVAGNTHLANPQKPYLLSRPLLALHERIPHADESTVPALFTQLGQFLVDHMTQRRRWEPRNVPRALLAALERVDLQQRLQDFVP